MTQQEGISLDYEWFQVQTRGTRSANLGKS